MTVSLQTYACTAKTNRAGRCRENSLKGDVDCFCSQHAGLRDAGREVNKVGRADVILWKRNVGGEEVADLLRLGVEETTRDTDALDKAHGAEAEKLGRKAQAIRKGVNDSGVPV